VTSAVAEIYRGSNEQLRLGRIDARRDWGWAPDFVEGMEKVMNHKDSGDFVLATGEVHTVEDLIKYAFKNIDVDDYSEYVIHDTSNDRHVDPKNLIGDRSRAKSELIWEPSRNLSAIIGEMVRYDIALLDNQELQWFPKFGQ
jgi:GDPmannose 4,6-dehydratase